MATICLNSFSLTLLVGSVFCSVKKVFSGVFDAEFTLFFVNNFLILDELVLLYTVHNDNVTRQVLFYSCLCGSSSAKEDFYALMVIPFCAVLFLFLQSMLPQHFFISLFCAKNFVNCIPTTPLASFSHLLKLVVKLKVRQFSHMDPILVKIFYRLKGQSLQRK